jgi:hypothetical protein
VGPTAGLDVCGEENISHTSRVRTAKPSSPYQLPHPGQIYCRVLATVWSLFLVRVKKTGFVGENSTGGVLSCFLKISPTGRIFMKFDV